MNAGEVKGGPERPQEVHDRWPRCWRREQQGLWVHLGEEGSRLREPVGQVWGVQRSVVRRREVDRGELRKEVGVGATGSVSPWVLILSLLVLGRKETWPCCDEQVSCAGMAGAGAGDCTGTIWVAVHLWSIRQIWTWLRVRPWDQGHTGGYSETGKFHRAISTVFSSQQTWEVISLCLSFCEGTKSFTPSLDCHAALPVVQGQRFSTV